MLWVTMMIVCRRFEAEDEFLDGGVATRIERARGFVHEDDLGLHRERAGEAEALLLADGKRGGGLAQAVAHFVPQRGFAQGGFDRALPARSRDSWRSRFAPKRTFSRDARGKDDGLLKEHADAGAQRVHIDRARWIRRAVARRRSTRRPGMRSLSD